MTLTKRHRLGGSIRLDNYDRIMKVYNEKGISTGEQIDTALDYYRENPPGTFDTKISEIKQQLKQDLKEELYKEIIEFLIKANK